MEALERHPDGSYTFVLGASKTNQLGLRRPHDAKPLEGMAAEALSGWLAASGLRSSALWRAVRGTRLGAALSASANAVKSLRRVKK